MLHRVKSLNYVLLLLLLCLLITAPANASFERAMEIYSSGRFVEAKEAFEAMAAIGDRASLFNLGVMYYRGEAVDINPARAYVLMMVANEGIEDESFARTAKAVHSKLDETQVREVDGLYDKISSIYGKKNIEENIFPQLLDDEDCPPEIQPIKRTIPQYPESELAGGKMGLVYGEYTISPEGYPREINITSSTGWGFTKATIKAMQSHLYEATPTGKPIMGHRQVMVYQIKMRKGDKYRTTAIINELDDLKEKSENDDVVAQYLYGHKINSYRYFQAYIKGVDLQYREANKWYTKSAHAGLTNAQYEIGRNMLEGRGCAVDKKNGFKWIKAAAVGGYSPAQAYLATSEISGLNHSTQKARAVVSWLRNAAQADNYAAKVLLSWELATTADDSLRNVDEALSLLKDRPSTYSDEIRILETKAVAFAHKGNYKKAVKFQKKASKLAESKGWTIPKLNQRLDAYSSGRLYSGSYY